MAEPNPPASQPPLNVIDTPVRRELDRILSVRGRAREKLLLEAENPAAVVSLLPPEELYFTLKEIDPGAVPSVLAHARTEQVAFALDLDLWRRDRILGERTGPWLATLASCGPGPLARWLSELDIADLTLLLGKLVTVHLPRDGEDPMEMEFEGRAPITLDGFYHVRCAEKYETLVRTALTVLRDADADRYVLLMEALARDVDAELEEHCYEARQRRLAERGFPDWEEALEAYTPVEVTDPDALPARIATMTGPEEGPEVPPRYPVTAVDTDSRLLARALGRVASRASLDTLWTELAYLTNKILVADGLPPDRVDSFQRALRKVAGYASIGLESLVGPDEASAARVLERHYLQHVFGVGWARVRRAGARARRLYERGWPDGHKERLLFLDPPLPETVEGLLRPHPLRFVPDGVDGTYENFESLAQIREAEHRVAQAEFLGRHLLSVVELRLGDLKEALARIDTENLKGSTVFLTALVNASMGREFRFTPIERGRVGEGLARLWADDRPPRKVKPELVDAAVAWSRTVGTLKPNEEPLLREFVATAFGLLEEEFGHLTPGETPDPRFTRGLWIV